MTYDVHTIRSHFPSLNTGLAFFCGPGGSQVPLVVGAAIAHAITKPISNRSTNTESEKNAKEFAVDFREALGDLFDTAADVDAQTHAFRAMCAELVQ
jgi:selenocysteine lyase/cysteine desulfurase